MVHNKYFKCSLMIWRLTNYQTLKDLVRYFTCFCTELLKDTIQNFTLFKLWVQIYIVHTYKSVTQPCDCTEGVFNLHPFFAVRPLVELDPRLQLKPKLPAEPGLFMEPHAAVELTQHENTQETGESLQHTVPVLPTNSQLMFQPIAQAVAQPQPVKPPSPKREPAYSEQVRSGDEVLGKINSFPLYDPLANEPI